MSASLEELERNYSQGVNPLAYIPLAEELRRRRQYVRAIEVCQEGMKRGMATVRARTLLGTIYCDLGQYQHAIRELRQAVEEAPGSYEPTLMLAKALTRERDFVEAERVLSPLLVSHSKDPEVQFLARVIRAEISNSITNTADAMAKLRSTSGDFRRALRQQLEDFEGVDALFEFGLVEESGDIFFEEREGEELDDDIKIMLIECARLTMKLDFGTPRQAILETASARLFFLLRHGRGLMAVASPSVKLGRLRFLMDQYLQAEA